MQKHNYYPRTLMSVIFNTKKSHYLKTSRSIFPYIFLKHFRKYVHCSNVFFRKVFEFFDKVLITTKSIQILHCFKATNQFAKNIKVHIILREFSINKLAKVNWSLRSNFKSCFFPNFTFSTFKNSLAALQTSARRDPPDVASFGVHVPNEKQLIIFEYKNPNTNSAFHDCTSEREQYLNIAMLKKS